MLATYASGLSLLCQDNSLLKIYVSCRLSYGSSSDNETKWAGLNT